MPLLPSALPPKGEARGCVANDFLNLIALPVGADRALAAGKTDEKTEKCAAPEGKRESLTNDKDFSLEMTIWGEETLRRVSVFT